MFFDLQHSISEYMKDDENCLNLEAVSIWNALKGSYDSFWDHERNGFFSRNDKLVVLYGNRELSKLKFHFFMWNKYFYEKERPFHH